MKIFNFISCAIFAVLLSSCVTAQLPPEPVTYVDIFDYSKVSSTFGVGFTESDAVNFDYSTVASLYIVEKGGYLETKKVDASDTDIDRGDDIYFKTKRQKRQGKYTYFAPDPQKGLAACAAQAKALGGDYVLNLKIQFHNGATALYEPSYYVFTGMIVKRK